MTEELKSCPFCGGKAKFKSHEIGQHGHCYVACEDCAAYATAISWRMYDGASEEDKQLAIEAWNRRAAEEELENELKIAQTQP